MVFVARKVRIAIDTLGCDYAPEETVLGAVLAARADGDLETIRVSLHPADGR